jgi:hypothetical protein
MADVMVETCNVDGERTFPIRANSREPPSSFASSSSLKVELFFILCQVKPSQKICDMHIIISNLAITTM